MPGFTTDSEGWFGISHREWLNPESLCLLIVDMQNYDASRKWKIIGTSGTGTSMESSAYYYGRIETAVVPAIRKVLGYFRENGLTVIHTVFASRFESSPDMPPLWKHRFVQHEQSSSSGKPFDPFVEREEMRIIRELEPLPAEPVLTKVTGSAFLSTPLDSILRGRNIKSIVICGAWGNSCVEDTIRTGCDMGYLMTCMEDGVVSPDEGFHSASIRVLGEMYCQVRSSDWIIEYLNGVRSARE